MILTGVIVGVIAAALSRGELRADVPSRPVAAPGAALSAAEAPVPHRRPAYPPSLREAEAPVIYVVTHQSRLDPALMLSLLPGRHAAYPRRGIGEGHVAGAVARTGEDHRLQRRAPVRQAAGWCASSTARAGLQSTCRKMSSRTRATSASIARCRGSRCRDDARIVPCDHRRRATCRPR